MSRFFMVHCVYSAAR